MFNSQRKDENGELKTYLSVVEVENDEFILKNVTDYEYIDSFKKEMREFMDYIDSTEN